MSVHNAYGDVVSVSKSRSRDGLETCLERLGLISVSGRNVSFTSLQHNTEQFFPLIVDTVITAEMLSVEGNRLLVDKQICFACTF